MKEDEKILKALEKKKEEKDFLDKTEEGKRYSKDRVNNYRKGKRLTDKFNLEIKEYDILEEELRKRYRMRNRLINIFRIKEKKLNQQGDEIGEVWKITREKLLGERK